MKALIAAGLAGALCFTATAPGQAQNYRQDQQQYDQAQRDYQQQLRAYDQARAQYERDWAEYERRYGPQRNYPQFYGPPPPPPPPAYGPSYGKPAYPAPGKPGYGYRNNNWPSCNRDNDQAGGAIVGALIGGALGAAIAGDDSTAEGAVLGAIVGGTLGANIAGNGATASRYAPRCDNNGYYFTYDQTFYYREGTRDRRGRSGRYDYNYYNGQGCRLALAPDDRRGGNDYRYVRVCPDRQSRYRITN